MASSTPEYIHVLAAVVERDGKYLVCKRPAHKRHGGLWEFPGGKLEAGESLADAAIRELREELGVRVTAVGEPMLLVEDAGSSFVIEFVPTAIAGTPHCLEHEELRWLSVLDLSALPLAPSDKRFLQQLASTVADRMKHRGGACSEAALQDAMRPWMYAWGLGGMEQGTTIRFDPRLRRTIGRCDPIRGRITLHPDLEGVGHERLLEVLCHEAAHLASYHLFGGSVAAHGAEWAELVRKAGHVPNVSAIPDMLRVSSASSRPPRARVVHVCPVCHSQRVSSRAVSQWRCAECVTAGLEGRMEIIRYEKDQ